MSSIPYKANVWLIHGYKSNLIQTSHSLNLASWYIYKKGGNKMHTFPR